jgi:tRNA A-37 threonylcarbamoyl transferase component Bud32
MYIKYNVEYKEYAIQQHVYNLRIVNVPKIYNYDNKELTMKKINNDCISNIYGENIENVPKKILSKIRNIIKKLYNNNIAYPDITGYNFMEDDKGKIWIIDFGHASLREELSTDPFILNFINGLNEWNPEFR